MTRIFRASIKDERELVRYVARVTLLCAAAALAVDVVNQLSFFIDWATCLRSWAVTVILVLALAIPICRTIGRAQLELYRAKLFAEELSRTDELTGLPNRRALIEAADAAQNQILALMIVDVDRFKRVNDTHGHLAGDAVIRAVGQMMAAELKGCGQVARVGGDEFALISSGVSAELLTRKLIAFRARVGSTPIVINSQAVRITVSAGVSLRREGETFDQLYAAADRALYAAKESGRNRLQFADSDKGLFARDAAAPLELHAQPLPRSA